MHVLQKPLTLNFNSKLFALCFEKHFNYCDIDVAFCLDRDKIKMQRVENRCLHMCFRYHYIYPILYSCDLVEYENNVIFTFCCNGAQNDFIGSSHLKINT